MSAAMSPAIRRGSIGRSMSAVRPCPWRSGTITLWPAASAGSSGPNVSPDIEPAVQQDHGRPSPWIS